MSSSTELNKQINYMNANTTTNTNTNTNFQPSYEDISQQYSPQINSADLFSNYMASGQQHFTPTLTYYIAFIFVFVFFIWLIMRIFFGGGGGASVTAAASSNGSPRTLSNILDIIVVLFVLTVYGGPLLFSTYEERNQRLKDDFNYLQQFLQTPSSFIVLIMIIIFINVFSFLFSIPAGADNKPYTVLFIENMAWILLIFCVISLFFKYILHIDFMNWSNTIIGGAPTPPDMAASSVSQTTTINSTQVNNISASSTPPQAATATPATTDEVFNVGNNLYTYEDAQAICSSYGATMATYDQVEAAYDKGGEWCNYGWSANQMALFPTQKLTWTNLQTNKGHENDCGRPGVNGGYIANPYIKFGVNCYGKKPPKPDGLVAPQSILPKTPNDVALEKKVDYWKTNSNGLSINFFNTAAWNQNPAPAPAPTPSPAPTPPTPTPTPAPTPTP